MPFIGFAESNLDPYETYERILRELEERKFKINFSKHHWMGDVPFGLVIAENNTEVLAIRWHLGKKFKLKLEEANREDFDEFVDDTLGYLRGD